MTRKVIDIQGYWMVIVYENIDYGHFLYVLDELRSIGCTPNYNKLRNSKAFTCSNIDRHISIIGINHASYYSDYINSVVHECEHVKQAMLQAYNIEDEGEPPAYTIGYLVLQVLRNH